MKIPPPPDGSHDTMFDTACDFLAPDLRPIPPQVLNPLMGLIREAAPLPKSEEGKAVSVLVHT